VLLKYVYDILLSGFFLSCLFLLFALTSVPLCIDLGILDLVLNFPGYHRWKFFDVLRNILKVIVCFIWVIILPLLYVHSFKGAPQILKELLSFFKQIKGIPALYMLAVALYMLPNLLAAALFLFPMLRRWIENSDWHIVRFFLWWSQVVMFSVLLNV
jgi:callose synthase